MIKEYSYGAVLYKIVDNTVYYLIEYMMLGHISLPKGHIEKGETIEECIRREIKEELNLEIDLNFNHHHTITYSPYKGISKDVTFYLGTPLSDNIITQKEEVLEAKYLKYDDAYNILTHDSDKEVLKDMNSYIKENLL